MTSPDELDFYNEISDELKLVIDVGCQFDDHWRDINDQIIVHAFDPVSDRESDDRFIFNKVALGNEEGHLDFHSGYSRITSGANEENLEPDRQIQMIKLASYIKYNSLSNIDLLKIDTESWDFEVIKGADDYIWDIKIIQVEHGWNYYGYDNKFGDIINYLGDKFNYKSIGGHPQNIVFLNKNYDI